MCIPGSVLLFLAKIVEIDIAEVGPKTMKFAHVARTDEVRVLLMTIFLGSFLTFWYVGHYLLLFVLNFREIGQN